MGKFTKCEGSIVGTILQTKGNLKQHIQNYAQQNDLESRIAFKNIPRGAGAKCHQQKPCRGNNNVEQEPLLEELDRNSVHDPNLDFAKPCKTMSLYGVLPQGRTGQYCFCQRLPKNQKL